MALRTVTILIALAATTSPAASQTVGNCSTGVAEAYLDIGNVRARIRNNGSLFGDNPDVYNIPKGSNSNAIYAANLWLAGMAAGSLKMAATLWGPFEYWPGPLDESGNPPTDCAPFDRLWKISKSDVVSYEATGVASPDLADWPTGLGAPTIDASGDEIDLSSRSLADRMNRRIDLASGERPMFTGDQMIWWIMNDMGNTHVRTQADPLAVEVHGLAFAFDAPGHVGNATFYRYTILSRRPDPLTDVYMGIFSDVDLGDFADDYGGSDSLLSLAYAYNADRFDGSSQGFGTHPPALGFDLMLGPIVPSPGDVARVGTRTVQDYRNLPTTSVLVFGSGGAIASGPETSDEFYNYIRGRWEDGSHLSWGGYGVGATAKPTNFIFSGDAAHCAYWTECKPHADRDEASSFGDRRMSMSSGPFTIDGGGGQEFVFALVYGRGSDHLDSVTALKEADVAVQRFFDSGFTEWPELPALVTSVPTLTTPGTGAYGQPTTIHFEWACPSDAVYCQMQLADDAGFGSPQELFYAETADLLLEADKTYWWRARALGRSDTPGPWSVPWSFHTGSTSLVPAIVDFSVVSNGAGPLNPPDCGAFGSAGFPLVACGGSGPDASRQQSTALGRAAWAIHAGDVDDRSFESYVSQSFGLAGDGTPKSLGYYDYEVRFTADGGRAELSNHGPVIDVPFELWRIGPGTADDPSDDVRLIPRLVDFNERGIFDIGGDHVVSDGGDDAYSDRIYFKLPDDDSPGQAGYDAYFAGTGDASYIIYIQVLVCIDCGSAPPYPQPFPEVGTTFRITTSKERETILAAPASGPVVEAGDICFYWSTASESHAALQIALDPDFRSLLIDLPDAASPATVPLPEAGEYYWRAGSDEFGWSQVWVLNVASGTASDPATGLPTEFALDPAYPNPFNPTTTIRYALPVTSPVQLDVFDVLGRRVAMLADDPAMPAGFHETRFDASRLASGVYLVSLRAGPFYRSRTVVLLR